jgi:WD40 repeat protein
MEIINFKSAINSLSISPDSSSIICGGREIFKVLSLSDFSEICNLRIGKPNLNYSTQDLDWHHSEKEWVLSAAKNSCIVLWNLNKISGNKLETIFKGHSTVVNRVKWHPSIPDIFISAGQDGFLGIWDRRAPDITNLFHCDSEGARDVSFSHHKEHLIGASFDSGSVQIWDWRKKQSLKKIVAHKRSALSIDWHPLWPDIIASGGSDKSLKVWNSQTGDAIYKIQAPEPVARVKWLPRSTTMIASASHTHDNNLYVWDIENPVLPDYIYRGHSQPIKDFMWISSDTVITCSDDKNLIRQHFVNGYSPKNDRPKSFVNINSLNTIAAVFSSTGKNSIAFNSLGDIKKDIKTFANGYLIKGDIEKTCNVNSNVTEDNRGVWEAIGMLNKISVDCSNSWLSALIEESLNETIDFHAEKGDLPTSACISSVLGLKGPVKEYSELLRQMEMTVEAAKLSIPHTNLEIFLRCKCGKSIEDSICPSCNNQTDCIVCGSATKGLYSWCQGCGHGGHSMHISNWFKTHSYCPTGCGHACMD